jgi:hypothetical protein
LIESEYYQINLAHKSLSELIFSEKSLPEPTFWSDATKYTSESTDESFVEEVAYMLVTVFRTGA